jgi:hypothetical protein
MAESSGLRVQKRTAQNYLTSRWQTVMQTADTLY